MSDAPDGQSELRINADLQLMGHLSELGQPLIKRKADGIFQEFANNLKKLLAG